MKFIILSFVTFSFILVSCKKDYSCTCTELDFYNGVQVDAYVYSYKVEKASKIQAQAACNEATISYSDGLDSYTKKCDLTKK